MTAPAGPRDAGTGGEVEHLANALLYAMSETGVEPDRQYCREVAAAALYWQRLNTVALPTPAPVAEPAETRAGRAALDAYEAIPYDNDLSRADIHALIGRAALAALPAPAVPGDAESREAVEEFASELARERIAHNATLAEVAFLRRSLADAEAKVAAETVPCTCGYGGFHEELNPRCERNQAALAAPGTDDEGTGS